MPRRRQSAASRAVSFEVVEDLDDELVPPGASAEAAAADRSPPAGDLGSGAGEGADVAPRRLGEPASGVGDAPSGGRAIRWKPWTAAAGVLALVVCGLAIGGEIEERRTASRLVASEGGVLPFTGPPRELWSLDLSDRVWMPSGGLLLGQVGVEGLTAVDVLSGNEVWQAVVGPDAICGRSGTWQTFVQEAGPLLCLSGTADAMVVSVLGPEGQVTASRDLGPVDEGSSYAVGPGATVVHVRRDGPVGPPVGPREIYDENGESSRARNGASKERTDHDDLPSRTLWGPVRSFVSAPGVAGNTGGPPGQVSPAGRPAPSREGQSSASTSFPEALTSRYARHDRRCVMSAPCSAARCEHPNPTTDPPSSSST